MRTLKALSTVLLVVLISGCATSRVGKDLARYVNQGVLNIAELETRSLQEYAAVTGPNFTTEQRVYEALRDEVIPLYKRFLDGLRGIRPETDEVKKVHGVYVHGAALIHEGFKEKMYGIKSGDESIILAANEKIEKGRIETERWRKELLELAEKNGVRQEGKK